MRWERGRRSDNVEDRRGVRVGRGVAIGGLGGLGTLVVIVLALLFGVDPLALLQATDGGAAGGDVASGPAAAPPRAPGEDRLLDFARVVLGETELAWGSLFERAGAAYEPPRLVVFTGAVASACGQASSASGPFYCPADARIYLDLEFFDRLARMGGPGDFAAAYVIAHEVGHHVQHLLGTAEQVHRARERAGEAEANALSVRLELQADCYAGIFAHHADRVRGLVEAGDVDEALGAAAAIGDDTLQRRAQGYVVPESFTHGSAAERAAWFRRGYAAGAVADCDTFAR